METADGGADVRPKSYRRVIEFIAETPWAILPSALGTIRAIIAERADGNHPTGEEIAARLGVSQPSRQASSVGTVAVLPLYGVLVPRANLMTDMSGGTSVQRFAQAFDAALNNPDIGAILIDVDSPGGSVAGITELAAQIREARGVKPIVAVANATAASAAYNIASQADEIVVTPSGAVGSIGVLAAHDDLSGALDQGGVKRTLIYAGKYKTEGNPFEPLSDEARAAIQERVDTYYGMFVADVAAGRGVSEDAVRSGFGEGRLVLAEEAVKLGMADRVATFEETVASLLGKQQPQDGQMFALGPPPGASSTTTTAANSGLSFADEATFARDAVLDLVDRTRSLAEVRDRGRLTAAKREQLTTVVDALSEAHETVSRLLADTEPVDRAGATREFARFVQANLTTEGDA